MVERQRQEAYLSLVQTIETTKLELDQAAKLKDLDLANHQKQLRELRLEMNEANRH